MVDALCKMQDRCQSGQSCLPGWQSLPLMLLKVVLQDDVLEVYCIAFLLVDAVLMLQV